MGCYAIFFNGKQIRVFSYRLLDDKDKERALSLTIDFSNSAKKNGYIYNIEDFGLSGVGVRVKI